MPLARGCSALWRRAKEPIGVVVDRDTGDKKRRRPCSRDAKRSTRLRRAPTHPVWKRPTHAPRHDRAVCQAAGGHEGRVHEKIASRRESKGIREVHINPACCHLEEAASDRTGRRDGLRRRSRSCVTSRPGGSRWTNPCQERMSALMMSSHTIILSMAPGSARQASPGRCEGGRCWSRRTHRSLEARPCCVVHS